MWKKNTTAGFFVAVDGPNGAGKSTLISAVKQKMESKGIAVHVTKEPTDTELGNFTRQFAEKQSGKSLACLVAADRYEHIANDIIPALHKGSLVISDRYILSSLILQEIDGVSADFILKLHDTILQPDLQIAVFADSETLQQRLQERPVLTRFEKENQSNIELSKMNAGLIELKKRHVSLLEIDNTQEIQVNAEKIILRILSSWRPHEALYSV